MKKNIFGHINITSKGWARAAIYAAIIGMAYFSAFKYLLHLWKNDDFSYISLVPFFVLFLVWEKRKRLEAIPSNPSWTGIVFLIAGMILYWLGELGGEYTMLFISLWLVIVGIVWLHFGWYKVRTIWFALVMMLAMFPPPNTLCVRTSLGLKTLSSQLGVSMLHLWGISAFREGNIIDLGFTQLQVVDACSGLRYLIPLMVLSLLFAHWFMEHFWKRLVLFFSAVPLAVFINSFRISMTGVLYRFAGQETANGFFHGFSGGLIFVFALPVLFIIIWFLKKLPPKDIGFSLQVADVPPGGYPQIVVKNKKDPDGGWMAALFWPRFLIAIILLLGTFAIANTFELHEKIPTRKPFSQFPMVIGNWRGARQIMDSQFIDRLKFTDYISANYYDRQGKAINFYVAYYDDQRKGESIHSPETCLPSSGWDFREAGLVLIAVGERSVSVNRAVMEKDAYKEIAYYWFPMRGKILTKLYQIKVNNFWDSVTKNRTDGAMVMIMTPIYPSENPKQVEDRLRQFVADVRPVLKDFLPE